MKTSLWRTAALGFFAFGSATLARGADYGLPLSDDEVACEENQGHRLLLRMGSNAIPNLFVWRSAASGGVYRGLIVPETNIAPPGPHFLRDERQLAFDLIFKAAEDLLNPARTRLPQATLVRRDEASNLAATAGGPILGVSVDLIPVENPVTLGLPLVINNEPANGKVDLAGRGVAVDDLTTACHDQVSEFDLRVAEILSRTVRALNCTHTPTVDFCSSRSYKAVTFRGQEPLTYRMDLVQYAIVGENSGLAYSESRMALLFRFQVDSQGRLTTGDVQLLPQCTAPGQPNCTTTVSFDTSLLVLPPIWPGRQTQGPEVLGRAALLTLTFRGDPAMTTFATINWADLLRDSSWD
jgi:hypothetical protein